MRHISKQSDSTKPGTGDNLDQRHRAQLSELKNANALLHDLAWEIEEVEQRLQSLISQREGPTDIFLEREINTLQRRHAALEDQMIHQMLHADALAAEVELVWQNREQCSSNGSPH